MRYCGSNLQYCMFQLLHNRFRRAVLSVSSSAAIDDLPGEHSSAAIVSSFYGMRREVSARSTPFIQTTDAPAVLLGKDLGPTPMEELLVALASSTTTLAYRAAVAGIQVEEIECEVEGDMELQSTMEPAKSGEKGFDQIGVIVHVKSAASEEQLTALCASSPVLESLKRPIPVSISVKKD